MANIKEIISAWASKRNPTPEEQSLAEMRYKICETCPKRVKKFGFEICGECGCPLDKKVFTPKREQACPLDKWSEIDKKFG